MLFYLQISRKLNYTPTEKALPFTIEKDHHRGCGGYASFNRYWLTRTFDDSIKNELNVTPELITDVRAELADMRAARRAANTVLTQEPITSIKKPVVEESTSLGITSLITSDGFKTAGIITIAAIGIGAAGFLNKYIEDMFEDV